MALALLPGHLLGRSSAWADWEAMGGGHRQSMSIALETHTNKMTEKKIIG